MSLVSEDIEPTAAKIIGELFRRCEVAKKTGESIKVEGACANFWYGVKALSNLATALVGGNESGDPSCVHFSIAANNQLQRVRDYIMAATGLDPEKQPMWN